MKRNMRHTEKAVTHPISIGGLNAAISASTWQDMKNEVGGWNGAAIQARIDYMRRAVNQGLTEKDCLDRAQRTLCNLASQL